MDLPRAKRRDSWKSILWKILVKHAEKCLLVIKAYEQFGQVVKNPQNVREDSRLDS